MVKSETGLAAETIVFKTEKPIIIAWRKKAGCRHD